MAVSTIKNPLNPIDLTVVINTGSATGELNAYKIGRLVFVIGRIEPKITGVDLVLATISGVRVVDDSSMCAQIGGYNNASQELFFVPHGGDTLLRFNVKTISDLKINACFIATN